jgi:hypothetical protein
MKHDVLGRRAVLSAPALLSAAPAIARVPLDLALPADSLTAVVKLRGDLAGGRVLQWYSGILSLLVPGRMPAPVCRYQGVIRTDWARRPDGAYAYRTFDLGFFGDLATGRHAERLTNPITGAQVEPMQVRDGPIASIYSVHGVFRDGARLDASKSLSLPWETAGDQVWYTADLPFEYVNPLPPAEFPKISNSTKAFQRNRFTYKGRRSELEDETTTSAPMETIMLATSTVHPWLEIGAVPATQQILTVSHKIAGLAEASPEMRAFLDTVFPDYLTVETPFVGAGNSFERYKRERLGILPK